MQVSGLTADSVSTKDFTKCFEEALARTGRQVPLKQGRKGLIPATAKTDTLMQAFLDDDDPVVAALARARLEKGSSDQKLAARKTSDTSAKLT